MTHKQKHQLLILILDYARIREAISLNFNDDIDKELERQNQQHDKWQEIVNLVYSDD